MQVVARRALRDFWDVHPRSAAPLQTWYTLVAKAKWSSPADVRAMFNSADFVADNRVIFNIAGNNYRLVAHVSYEYRRVLIKFVGTHAEYDRIDAETV